MEPPKLPSLGFQPTGTFPKCGGTSPKCQGTHPKCEGTGPKCEGPRRPGRAVLCQRARAPLLRAPRMVPPQGLSGHPRILCCPPWTPPSPPPRYGPSEGVATKGRGKDPGRTAYGKVSLMRPPKGTSRSGSFWVPKRAGKCQGSCSKSVRVIYKVRGKFRVPSRPPGREGAPPTSPAGDFLFFYSPPACKCARARVLLGTIRVQNRARASTRVKGAVLARARAYRNRARAVGCM